MKISDPHAFPLGKDQVWLQTIGEALNVTNRVNFAESVSNPQISYTAAFSPATNHRIPAEAAQRVTHALDSSRPRSSLKDIAL